MTSNMINWTASRTAAVTSSNPAARYVRAREAEHGVRERLAKAVDSARRAGFEGHELLSVPAVRNAARQALTLTTELRAARLLLAGS